MISSETEVSAVITRGTYRSQRHEDDIELRSLDDAAKHEEADNILSYEEQTQIEMERLSVHEVFSGQRVKEADQDNEESARIMDMSTLNRVMEMDDDLRATLQAVDIHDAFYRTDLDTSHDEVDDSGIEPHVEEDYVPDLGTGENEEPSPDSTETMIETCDTEEEMAVANADDDDTDNIYLATAEWLQVIQEVQFANDHSNDNDSSTESIESEHEEERLSLSFWIKQRNWR